jgi:hypothetical protein
VSFSLCIPLAVCDARGKGNEKLLNQLWFLGNVSEHNGNEMKSESLQKSQQMVGGFEIFSDCLNFARVGEMFSS